MTSTLHDTPTSRLCEVSKLCSYDFYLMIMGDEPLINYLSFDLIVPENYESDDMYVSVLTNEISTPSEVIDFSNQKCVRTEYGDIMFISRSPIPYPKGTLNVTYEKVTGIQMVNRKALDFFSHQKKSKLEIAEENDLMRFIEHDIKVKVLDLTIRRFLLILLRT